MINFKVVLKLMILLYIYLFILLLFKFIKNNFIDFTLYYIFFTIVDLN
jgi:hypothetical protein